MDDFETVELAIQNVWRHYFLVEERVHQPKSPSKAYPSFASPVKIPRMPIQDCPLIFSMASTRIYPPGMRSSSGCSKIYEPSRRGSQLQLASVISLRLASSLLDLYVSGT